MKRRSFKFGSFPSSALILCSLVWVACASVTVPAMFAQDTAQRMVKGKVIDKQDAGIKGAVVYLKDGHSLAVKSFFSGDDGSYRFAQLAQNVDYELWAESNGKKSSVKTISSFNSKPELEITLKIDLTK
jgi:hypothetical protein